MHGVRLAVVALLLAESGGLAADFVEIRAAIAPLER